MSSLFATKRSSRIRRHLPALLITSGAVVLSYVGFQYGNMYLQQRSLAREWRLEQSRLVDRHLPGLKSVSDDGLTRISAPEIGLDAIVIEGADLKALALGPGHMTNTALPGDVGNMVITAHSDTFFRHLDQLHEGDTVTVQRNGRSFSYTVTDRRIVEANDMSVVEPTRDARMTLITCYPTYYIGPAPQRLVVFSKLVKDATLQAIAENAVVRSRRLSKAQLKKLTKTR